MHGAAELTVSFPQQGQNRACATEWGALFLLQERQEKATLCGRLLLHTNSLSMLLHPAHLLDVMHKGSLSIRSVAGMTWNTQSVEIRYPT